jgi:microcystin-dependent protein
MKSTLGMVLALLTLLELTFSSQIAFAANEITRLVPFQGRLHGGDNKIVSDGTYDLTFYIYETPTGGTSLWTETHPSVSVIHGYVNVLLGAISPMVESNYATQAPLYGENKNTVNFAEQKYLGISINGGAEMFPRSQLVPTFHAYTANHATHATQADNSDNLGGLPASHYAAASLSAQRLSNLSDLTNKGAARLNIDVYSKGEVGARYLDEASNLSDLENVTTSRTNLEVYSKVESNALHLNESENLSDLPNKATARANLSVYEKSEVFTKGQSNENFISSAKANSFVPVGTIIAWPVASLPANGEWLICDGGYHVKTTYPALYAVLRGSYGQNGSSFKVPDYRGVFLRGLDSGRGFDSSRSIGSYQDDTFKNHTHKSKMLQYSNNGGQIMRSWGKDRNSRYIDQTSVATGDAETRPKNTSVIYIIKAR